MPNENESSIQKWGSRLGPYVLICGFLGSIGGNMLSGIMHWTDHAITEHDRDRKLDSAYNYGLQSIIDNARQNGQLQSLTKAQELLQKQIDYATRTAESTAAHQNPKFVSQSWQFVH